MSKHRVLGFKPYLRLERRGQDGQHETEQPDHSASLGDSITSSTRIRFSVHTSLDMRAEKGSIRRPAGVTFTPRACRWNRRMPSSSSNALTRAVTLDCTVFSSAAA